MIAEKLQTKTPSDQPTFEIVTSRQFQNWLTSHQASLMFTTYQMGKAFMLGTNPDQTLHVTERTFSRCMGLSKAIDNTFWMSSLFQLWRFDNSLPPDGKFKDYDKVYLPQAAYTTGDIDIHDIMVGNDGRPIFVNTLFSCLATVSESHSFKRVWQPPFISKLVPEDRCHLNGLAERDGQPAHVTMVGMSDVSDGWREHRQNGGVVMDVQTNEIVCDGLSMPHSPRWYNGKLYLLEAGTGYFGSVDLKTNKFEKIAFCPGFLRGLDFVGNYAIVAISSARKNRTFGGLALDDNLKAANTQARCGLQIINLETGAAEHWVRLSGHVDELYDVKVLPKVNKPLLIGTQKDEIRTMISIEQ
ncbi:MAG: TIGR03032 family protein [Reichenbachiella sp.]|uniref:TIGR03032 family protein n=1 Tax=Reichenbachiella sp. TaxID=2184521 RepID=UPI0032636B23